MPRPDAAFLSLVACADDYLLEEALSEVVTSLCATLAVGAPETLPDDVTPEQLTLELCSPSLFSPHRVLLVRDASTWVEAKASERKHGKVDLEPLLEVLEPGLPEGLALVLAARCDGPPRGRLTEMVEQRGGLRWVPLPPAPKPWEEVSLSDEQRQVLLAVRRRAAPAARFTREAEDLLLERLGFAPRLLAQETAKLAVSAGEGEVDEELVRRLTFPAERSLEVVRDAILKRRGRALFDLLQAAVDGVPILDWRGERLDPDRLGSVVLAQVATLLGQMLYLRLLAADLEDEMRPQQTSAASWFPRRFKSRLAPQLLERITADDSSLLTRSGKPPSPWTLGQLFAAAGRYRSEELVAALADASDVEASQRGNLGLEALSSWLSRTLVRAA